MKKTIILFLTAISFGGIANAWPRSYLFTNQTNRTVFISKDPSSANKKPDGNTLWVTIGGAGQKTIGPGKSSDVVFFDPGTTIYIKTYGEPFAVSKGIQLSQEGSNYKIINVGDRNKPSLKIEEIKAEPVIRRDRKK